ATSLDPNYRQAFIMLAEAYRRAGDYSAARAALEHVLARNGQDAEAQAALNALEASATAGTSP
ncbi:tetratricopeptide repeat protein, partial [bacterium]|nr:tetratricopeptide repeat protein [bacterium]